MHAQENDRQCHILNYRKQTVLEREGWDDLQKPKYQHLRATILRVKHICTTSLVWSGHSWHLTNVPVLLSDLDTRTECHHSVWVTEPWHGLCMVLTVDV